MKKREDWKHVIRCKNEHTNRIREAQVSEIEDELTKMETHRSIQQLFLHIIQAWIHQRTPQFKLISAPDPIETHLPQLFDHQQEIGWDAFVQGILCRDWGKMH